MSNFHVGQKVVCVHDEWVGSGIQTRLGILCPLQKGEVYTVSEVGLTDGIGLSGVRATKPGIRVKEVPNPIPSKMWDAGRFRPVVERGTEKGMSILREILTKTGKPVEEAA